MIKLKSLDRVSETLLQNDGAIGLISTDTALAIVCIARNKDTVKRLLGMRRKPIYPGVVIGANLEQLVELGIKRRYLKAIEQFWPGPVSVLVPVGSDLSYLDAKHGVVAVRLPSANSLIQLLDKTGPLLALEIDGYDAGYEDTLDFYFNDTAEVSGPPSAIVRIIDDAVEVVRPGYGFER